MDFRHQVPPTITSPEPLLSTPPPLGTPGLLQTPTPPASSSTPAPHQRSLKWLWWSVSGFLIVGVLGGGYFAYGRGFISIPFLTPKSDALFDKMVDSISTIKSAQYRLALKIEGQDRNRSLSPIFSKNTNANTNSDSTYTTLDGLNQYFQSLMKIIPADLKVEGGVTVYVETDKLAQDANGLFAVNGSYTGSDVSVAVDVELRKVEKNLYGIIRKFPSLPIGFDLGSVKNKWIEVTPDDSFAEVSTSTLENKDLRKAVTETKRITKQALDLKFITTKQHLPAETVGGVRTEHYLLEIHADKLVTLLEALRDDRKARGLDTTDYDESIDGVKKPDIVSTIDRIVKNSRIEIWIDRNKGLLRQLRWGLTLVPDDSLERLKNKQMYFGATVTMEKVNEKVNIDKPSPTIDFDEATRLVTGITQDTQDFDKQVGRVDKVRSSLTLYKSKNGSYPESFDALNTGLKSIYTTCQEKLAATKTDKTDDPDAQARDEQRKSDLSSIRYALSDYYYTHDSRYPTDLSALAENKVNSNTAYLKSVPTDPTTKASYGYQLCDNTHFVLTTTLETSTEKYYLNEAYKTVQSTTPLACPTVSNTNTSSGPTSFSIEEIGGRIGLGDYNGSDFACSSEKKYRDGINVNDVYAGKSYGYGKDGEDYKLTYQLKITGDVSSYQKEYYVDGQNTATSKDSSIEKESSYEKSQREREEQLKNQNTNASSTITNTTNTNTSTTWSALYPCLAAAPVYNSTRDIDVDGLNDYRELYLTLTDPCKPDSDADGFNDGKEVDDGYNPLGTGTLATPTISNITTSRVGDYLFVSWDTGVRSTGKADYGAATSYGLKNEVTYRLTTHFGLYLTVGTGQTIHYTLTSCNLGSPVACASTADRTYTAPTSTTNTN